MAEKHYWQQVYEDAMAEATAAGQRHIDRAMAKVKADQAQADDGEPDQPA